MKIIIYGKPGCMDCEKTKMLCQIQSLEFEYLQLEEDYSQEVLNELVGETVRALPQVFIQEAGAAEGVGLRYVGGYDALRQDLQRQDLQKVG